METHLGWAVMSPTSSNRPAIHGGDVTRINHVTAVKDDELGRKLEGMYNAEFTEKDIIRGYLRKDKGALPKIENSAENIQGHCQLPLP